MTVPSTQIELEQALFGTKHVKVAGIDLDGVLRGKTMAKSKFLSCVTSGFGYCSVIFGWDMHDKCYTLPNAYDTQHSGNADLHAVVDLSTFRRIPWEGGIPLFLCTFHSPEDGHAPIPMCPRSMLTRVVNEAGHLGFLPLAGLEFEFFNYKGGVSIRPVCPLGVIFLTTSP
jgi:glutamine synthetase